MMHNNTTTPTITANTNTNTTTTTTTTTNGRNTIGEAELVVCIKWCEQIMNIPTIYQYEQLEAAFLSLPCMEAATYCIKQTALAPAPSVRYLLAIAGRIAREGWTKGGRSARTQSASASVQYWQRHQVPAQMYDQREYQPSTTLPDWMRDELHNLGQDAPEA